MARHPLSLVVLAIILGGVVCAPATADEQADDKSPSAGLADFDHSLLFPPVPPAVPVVAPDPVAPWSQRPLLLEAIKSPTATDSWSGADTPEGLREKFLKKYQGPWGELSSKLEVRDSGGPSDNPFAANKWEREDKLQLPLTGPVFVIGQLNASCNCTDTQEKKVIGKTGLACKVSPWDRWELQLRGVTAVTYDETTRASLNREQSEVMLELEARCPLAGKINLEYESTAAPALSVADRDRLKQDLRIAFPLGATGKLKLGAKHNLEVVPSAKPFTETEIYIGIDLKR
jgi:hypothetical protein